MSFKSKAFISHSFIRSQVVSREQIVKNSADKVILSRYILMNDISDKLIKLQEN